MLPWIIAGAVGAAGLVGYSCGALITALFGSSMALKIARMHPDWPTSGEDGDEVGRHDALVLRDLLRAAQPVIDSGDAAKALEPAVYHAFANAVLAAEERFDGWIEWAESGTASADEATA